jgi:DNA-directed RNA polymerase I subunit RPA1
LADLNNYKEIKSKIDSTSVPQFKKSAKKQMKKVRSENPAISKAELYKNHRGDPAISKFNPLRYFGAISEKIEDQLKHYIEKDSIRKKVEDLGNKAPKSRFQTVDSDLYKKSYFLKYMRSVVHPGENVGTIAG